MTEATATLAASAAEERTMKVWDPLVRIFHWSLVTSFAVAWLTAEDIRSLHEWAGYAAAALIAFRIVWGLIGPKYARFSQFVRGPRTVARYVGSVIRGNEPRYIGHNPAGSVMIMGLILAMAGTAVTGWMYTLDAFWGVKWVEETHETLATLMLLMVTIHVGGVILASWRHKENLVRAMLVGRKRTADPADIV